MGTSRALAKQIVDTYAEALFAAAQADDAVDAVGSQLEDVARTLRGHAELRDALLGDAIPSEARGAIAREVFAPMHPAVSATLGVMAERGNVDLLSSIVDAYTVVAEEKRNMVAIEVTTVVELTDALREAIKSKYAADMGKDVVLREKVDPSIIGGIIISTSGRKIDASIFSQLESARVTLSTAHTGGDV